MKLFFFFHYDLQINGCDVMVFSLVYGLRLCCVELWHLVINTTTMSHYSVGA